MNINLLSRTSLFWALALLLYIVPIVLLIFGVVPHIHRLSVVACMFFVAFFVTEERSYTLEALGVRKVNHRRGLIVSAGLVSTLIGVLLIVERGQFNVTWEALPLYLFFVLVAVPVQEFLYRSFLFAEMRYFGIKSEPTFVITSAALYSLLHFIYRDAFLVIGSFTLGVFLAMLYMKSQNFWVVSLAHAVVGLAFIWSR